MNENSFLCKKEAQKQHQIHEQLKFKHSLVADIFLIIIWCATIARRTPTPILTPTERIHCDKILLTDFNSFFISFHGFLCSVLTLIALSEIKIIFFCFKEIENCFTRAFDSVFLSINFVVVSNTHVTKIPRCQVHHYLLDFAVAEQLHFVQPIFEATSLLQHHCQLHLQNRRRFPPKSFNIEHYFWSPYKDLIKKKLSYLTSEQACNNFKQLQSTNLNI